MGIIKYADIFGDLHLVAFCHRAQFGAIDWERAPAGQPLRIRGIACETHNCEDNECGPDWHARATAVASRRPERIVAGRSTTLTPSKSWHLHRQKPQGRKARRPADRAADEIRSCHQPQGGAGGRQRHDA
jgi:hypothetical protein